MLNKDKRLNFTLMLFVQRLGMRAQRTPLLMDGGSSDWQSDKRVYKGYC